MWARQSLSSITMSAEFVNATSFKCKKSPVGSYTLLCRSFFLSVEKLNFIPPCLPPFQPGPAEAVGPHPGHHPAAGRLHLVVPLGRVLLRRGEALALPVRVQEEAAGGRGRVRERKGCHVTLSFFQIWVGGGGVQSWPLKARRFFGPKSGQKCGQIGSEHFFKRKSRVASLEVLKAENAT